MNGIEWARDDKDATYLSLFQNISLQNTLIPNRALKKFPMGIPYDYSCPSVKDVLEKRICVHYGLYFGTIKEKSIHASYCRTKVVAPPNPGVRHEEPETRQRVRPQRIAARRQGELLCALAMQ